MNLFLFVFMGLRLNNAWASGTVLRPFRQSESPLSSRSLVSGFKCKLRDSNSRPPYSRPSALITRLYTQIMNLYIQAPVVEEPPRFAEEREPDDPPIEYTPPQVTAPTTVVSTPAPTVTPAVAPPAPAPAARTFPTTTHSTTQEEPQSKHIVKKVLSQCVTSISS